MTETATKTAKEKVYEYMKEHKKADTGELIEYLNIDHTNLEVLINVLDELVTEGVIELQLKEN